MRILICKEGGIPVAGVVASALGDTAIYLLGATSDHGLNARGTYLLQWTLIKWLRENGVKWYDLGGIDPGRNPGVYHFKKGLSGSDVTHMNPMIACDSAMSSVIVKASVAMRRTFWGLRNVLPAAETQEAPLNVPLAETRQP
jgi:lipid II:glycine glycyltransferase (peptidoglycan interpeptide bridge formation enzyme)